MPQELSWQFWSGFLWNFRPDFARWAVEHGYFFHGGSGEFCIVTTEFQRFIPQDSTVFNLIPHLVTSF